jgi:hypothetical protein
MKLPSVMLAAALMLASAVCQARGPATSSFAPRGPEPHATLSHKNGVKRSAHKVSQTAKPAAVKHVVKHTGTHPAATH